MTVDQVALFIPIDDTGVQMHVYGHLIVRILAEEVVVSIGLCQVILSLEQQSGRLSATSR